MIMRLTLFVLFPRNILSGEKQPPLKGEGNRRQAAEGETQPPFQLVIKCLRRIQNGDAVLYAPAGGLPPDPIIE